MDTLSSKELSEHLANAEGTTAEEIERGATEIEIGRPWEGDVIDPNE
jgi:hypothetical protein